MTIESIRKLIASGGVPSQGACEELLAAIDAAEARAACDVCDGSGTAIHGGPCGCGGDGLVGMVTACREAEVHERFRAERAERERDAARSERDDLRQQQQGMLDASKLLIDALRTRLALTEEVVEAARERTSHDGMCRTRYPKDYRDPSCTCGATDLIAALAAYDAKPEGT